MAELFRHTDEDGYRFVVERWADGGLMVSVFPVQSFDRICAADLPRDDALRLLAALQRHYETSPEAP